jgi:hypothetical protein
MAGSDSGTCSHNNGHTTTRPAAINSTAHVWNNNYTVTDPATCIATGTETDTCSLNLEHTRTRDIVVDPNAHNYQWVATAAPTFINEGEETEVCTHNSSHTGDSRSTDSLPITTTAQWNSARTQLSGKTGNYTLNISGNIAVAGINNSNTNTFGTTPDDPTPLTVTLKGNGKLYLNSQGSLLNIGRNQTVIIDSANLTLQGLKSGQNSATQNNNTSVVNLLSGSYFYSAKLELRNGTISDNTTYDAGGAHGGGVSISNYTTFIMSGGKISGNTAYGGGNQGPVDGGGVCVFNGGSFIMTGGEISGNAATTNATGVRQGGGVRVHNGTFRIVTGTVYGSSAATNLRNTAPDGGAALYGTGSRGTFSIPGDITSTWNSAGTLSTTDSTIRVVDGVLQ